MKRKICAAILALLIAALAASCGTAGSGSGSETSTDSASNASSAVSASDLFTDSDYENRTESDANAVITLEGSQGTISDSTRGSSGETVTVTSKGTYLVTGSAENVTIVINDTKKSGNIYLLLQDVSMTNDSAPCIRVEACDKLIVQCLGSSALTVLGENETFDGVIDAEDDLTFTGSGSLTLTGAGDGVDCDDDVKITGAHLTVNAGKIGIQAGDSLCIGGGTVSVTSGRDGVQVENKTGTSFFAITSGTLTVEAGYDGVSVTTSGESFTGHLSVLGGAVTVIAGGGAENAKTDTSQKGLKCDGSVVIADGTVLVSSADDAVHGAAVEITGGASELASSDDGIHSGGALTVSGGSVAVTKAYEGMEALSVTVKDGTVRVTASDDGINAAGGSDGASASKSGAGDVTVSGGSVYVNAQGDGVDANGSILVSGGTLIVEGPSGSGNGALDRGDGALCTAKITGGTVLAIGSADMAVNFDSGTQCSALVALSGEAGTVLTVDDGSGFAFTASKHFDCVVYSSPYLRESGTVTVTAGQNSATATFDSGLYYSNVTKRQ